MKPHRYLLASAGAVAMMGLSAMSPTERAAGRYLRGPDDHPDAAKTPTDGADPVAKSDPAPAPKTADQVAPAQPAADPKPAAVGNAEGEDPSPPNSRKAANKKGKRSIVVWVQAGHESFGIGQILAVPADEAEALRGAGRVRYASGAEVEAAGKDIPEVEGV